MDPLTAGRVLAGRFRLIRALGHGGRGEVWLAEIGGGERVALKFPAGDAEFTAARRLVHPVIVRVHERIEGDPPFLVMQYVEGTDIGALRGAPYRDIVSALAPVAEALEYAHRQGVIHRDLKPSNVLRDTAGRCFVTDFGTGAASQGGSLPAMSPQQVDGETPAVADDVYGFGALLYELLTGAPLFHPGVTPERVRNEPAPVPESGLDGEPLPDRLRKLLRALLQKSPAQRPPGMAAVREALEEVLRDAGEIRPLARSRPVAAAEAPAPVPLARRPGLGARRVYVGVAALAVAGSLVIWYLPPLAPKMRPPPEIAKETPGAPVAPARPVPQAVLDEALGDFLKGDDELHKLGADKWGGADWTQLRGIAQAADAAYQARDTAAALAGYRSAASLAKGLLARAPEVLAAALKAGAAALEAGDQQQAIAQFETALAVSPQDPAARRGMDRARKLDQLLALLNDASAAEAAGKRVEALTLFQRAAALDGASSAAAAGIARLTQAAARDAYETHMARGFAAQAGRDGAAARTAFEAALRARPGDAQAQAALAQLDADQKLERLTDLQGQARSLEAQERWAEAVRRYEDVLKEDGNLAESQEALARARSRAELDEKLRHELGNADHFNDDAVFGRASALLQSARAIASPGPVLSRQVEELGRLLEIAATPVAVRLESDSMTDVTVFKVGRLGAFATRTLELRPGAYVAVGSRPGYRDVRRTFRVGPDAGEAPVVVRCEDPI